MKARLRHHVAALLLLAPAAATFVAQPAVAQQRVAAPQIQGLQINADDGLEAGSRLDITVQGSPGARAVVNLGKTNIDIALRETQRGVYRGGYTVRRSDRIDPTSVLNVRLTRNNQTARHSFTYPPSFQALAMGSAPAPVAVAAPGLTGAAPRIERFVTVPVGRLEPGRELRYRVHGIPGAMVVLEIPGVANDIAMREVSPGVYEGAYTIRGRDDLDAFSTAVATLRSGNRWVTSRLDRAFVRDGRAPTIGNLSPRHGDIVSPAGTTLVTGEFDDQGGRGVDPASVRILLSGRDITSRADITPHRFTYRSDLPPGHYTAEVTARDYAGNMVNKSWSFDVGGGARMGAAPGSLALTVSNPVNGAVVDAKGDLMVQGRTAPGARVRVRVDAVPPVVGQMLGVAQVVFDETVQADRDGYFDVTVRPRTIIPHMRYDVTLSAERGEQSAETRISVRQRG